MSASVWGGTGAAAAVLATPAMAYPPLVNAPMSGSAQTSGGAAAPAGTLWSEVPSPSGIVQGFLADDAAQASVADDFVIVDPEGWTLTEAVVYAYQPGALATDQPFTGAWARLWSGDPSQPQSQVVWDSGGNCLAQAIFAGLYRTDARGQTTRPVFALHLKISTQLSQGTYWLEWSASGTRGAGVWTPAMTGTAPASGIAPNAVQSVAGTWAPVGETPIGSQNFNRGSIPMTILGWVNGTSVTCWANCDGSVMSPFLNAQDFSCFLRHFAVGSPYANCDGSTTPPVLNVNDLQCFLASYVAGCSAP
jgi:hypothetical protein